MIGPEMPRARVHLCSWRKIGLGQGAALLQSNYVSNFCLVKGFRSLGPWKLSAACVFD